MNVLIIHPEFADPGGITNYFSSLSNVFSIEVNHFAMGRRVSEKTFLATALRLFRDYANLMKLLKQKHYDLIQVNPSLNFKALTRDGLAILLVKFYKIKTIVFFHGWEESFENKLAGIKLRLYLILYKKADAFIVLSSHAKNKLRQWGLKQPIYMETTAIDDTLIRGIDIQSILRNRIEDGKRRILFLARIIKEKGIYETIEAFSLLQRKHLNYELLIAGEGPELRAVKDYLRKKIIPNVEFAPYVKGEDKKRVFLRSHIYCFPSYYSEGLPISLLEAMAFGLPIIATSAGGIKDFFEEGKHGFIVDSKDLSGLASRMEKILSDRELYEKISFYNYDYARKNFMASKAAGRLEEIYKEIVKAESLHDE